MKNAALALPFVLLVASIAGCTASVAEDEGASTATEAAARIDCAAVLCAAVACEPGYVAKTSAGSCCPTCVRDSSLRRGDCTCSGGFMSASYCEQFGAPWTMKGDACVWTAKSQGGLTAEQCAAVGAKHGGDGSGSDIYNLGLTCSMIGGTADCTTKGCPTGQYCTVCKTTSGAANVCLPNGAAC